MDLDLGFLPRVTTSLFFFKFWMHNDLTKYLRAKVRRLKHNLLVWGSTEGKMMV